MFPLWFLVFIFLSAAILLANYHLWILAFFVAGGLLVAGFFSEKYSREAIIGAAALIIGVLYFNLLTTPAPERLPVINNTEINGIVKDYPRHDGQKADFTLQTDSNSRYAHRIKVYCNFPVKVRKGDRVWLKGSLKPPSRAGNPGEFDYRQYLEQNGIYYILSVKDEKDIQIREPAENLQALVNSYRSHSQKQIKEVLSASDAAIMLGMLLGIIEGIDSSEYSDYQKTGIVHIFSVSGLHVGFLLVLCAWIGSLLGLSRKARMLASITLLLLYASLTGWPVPVIRSVIMGGLGLTAYYSGRENQLINTLGLAGIVILLINPCALLQISFQLSFAAAWGLVYLFPLLKRRINYNHRWGDLLLVPICAQLAVLPLTACHFNLFSPLALLANIPVTYLSGGAVILGFLTLLGGGIMPFISSWLLYPAGLCIDLIRAVNQLVVSIPGAYLRVATPGLALTVLYYAGLILLIYGFCHVREERRASAWMGWGTGLMAVFILILCLPGSVYNRGQVELSFIDVGQGDCILIKTPRGKFILVDGGGSEFTDPGSRKVLPYLYHRGVRELFLALNTHPDTDHLQGLETVLKEMPVRYVAVPADLAESEEYQGLSRVMADKKVPFIPLAAGDSIDTGENLQIKVLHPPPNFGSDSANDQSLVLRIDFSGFSALLTGDIGMEPMRKLVERRQLRPVTVLKVPHHGSKNSLLMPFYEETRPEWAVISVGENNLFGHPHDSILAALKGKKVGILRTDRDGAVIFRTDGKRVRLTTGPGGLNLLSPVYK
ncbi:DNA internalization-related competence protein ComEC/Rec2 [Syntrophomonas curvata]